MSTARFLAAVVAFFSSILCALPAAPSSVPAIPADRRDIVGTVDPVGESWPGEQPDPLDAAVANNRLLAAKATAEGLDKAPSVRSRIETRLNRLWADSYWSEVVKPTVRLVEADLLAAAPPMEEAISVQQLIVPSREAAAALRGRALSGDDFGNIIAANSIGLSAPAGGKAEFVRRSSRMYPPAFMDSLFQMTPGEFSPVAETELGFAVVRVLAKKTAALQVREWADLNRERLLGQRARTIWAERKAALVRGHDVAVGAGAIAAYRDAMSRKAPVGPLMGEVAVTIDGVPLFLRDIADPSGLGTAHGAETLEALVHRRVEEYAIAREAARIGLPERFPGIARKEALLRDDILAREYVKAQTGGLAAKEEELKAYYEDHKGRFTAPRALDLSFIETRSEDRAKVAYGLLARGVPFEEVAARWSDNDEAPGGRFGWVAEDRLVPELSPVSALRPGEYAKTPIRTRGVVEGEELIVIPKLNAIREGRLLAYEEVDRAALERRVMARKRADAVRRILGDLSGETGVAGGGGR